MELKDLINDRLRISIRQFAKEVGLSRPTIQRILDGVGKPALLTVKKIADYFGEDYKRFINE